MQQRTKLYNAVRIADKSVVTFVTKKYRSLCTSVKYK